MDLNNLLIAHFQADSTGSPEPERYLPPLPSLVPEPATHDIQVPMMSPEKEIVRGEPGLSTPNRRNSGTQSRQSPIRSSSKHKIQVFREDSPDSEESELRAFRDCLMQPYPDQCVETELQKENIPPKPVVSAPVSSESEPEPVSSATLEVFFDKLHLRLHKCMHELLTSKGLLQSQYGDFVRANKKQASQVLGDQIDTLEAYMAELTLDGKHLFQTTNFSKENLEKNFRNFGPEFMHRLQKLRKNKKDAFEQRMLKYAEQSFANIVQKTKEKIATMEFCVENNADATYQVHTDDDDANWLRQTEITLEKVKIRVNRL